jgi:phospholipid/cholesterol/gamma-HCH transport system ATP-binding protein
MIKITNLWKSFESKQVLKGLSLEINRGEIMVIIGESGCGKSILLKQIIGIMKPDEGKIEVDGIEVTSLSRGELNKLRLNFGMLFQGGALFDSLTVESNVGFFLREHTDLTGEEISKKVRDVLEMVGLEGVENLMPAELSGGMRKRVALARAICMDPKIVLYDEPTSGVDPVMGGEINRLIRRLQERLRLTSIVVTHDIKSAFEIADRIAMLHDGRIIEVGTIKEIAFSQNSVVKRFIKDSFYNLSGGEKDA